MDVFEAIRRDERLDGLSIRALADRHGVHRRTVRQALENAVPPERKTPVRVAPKFFGKSPVFPFNKFPGVDPALGPEMRSNGEVMGVGENFGEAFAKAQLSAGTPLPEGGTVFLSVNDRHKAEAV